MQIFSQLFYIKITQRNRPYCVISDTFQPARPKESEASCGTYRSLIPKESDEGSGTFGAWVLYYALWRLCLAQHEVGQVGIGLVALQAWRDVVSDAGGEQHLLAPLLLAAMRAGELAWLVARQSFTLKLITIFCIHHRVVFSDFLGGFSSVRQNHYIYRWF